APLALATPVARAGWRRPASGQPSSTAGPASMAALAVGLAVRVARTALASPAPVRRAARATTRSAALVASQGPTTCSAAAVAHGRAPALTTTVGRPVAAAVATLPAQ